MKNPPPLVTGISPNEAPPGTRVTIRGENLGLDAKDLVGLLICGVDCYLSAEWKSTNKIIARTGRAKGKGDIIVKTRSGGEGSCTVTFTGYFIAIGALHESAIWVDESHLINHNVSKNTATSPMNLNSHEDPLGISDESTISKFNENDLLEILPDGSGNTSVENFSPYWFLLENHHGTQFDDLKAGLAYLKRNSGQREEGPLTFIKQNLSTFMDCQDALNDMHKLEMDSSITNKLEDMIVRSKESADLLFKDVLGRKDMADATRNALGVLQRFKFLFNMPCAIQRNVKKGDYDLVITDYTRAKSHFGDSDTPVFRKVYQEVENRISTFKDMLYSKLMQLPSTLEEQKKNIRFLCHLGVNGDPAWDCIINMHKWLIKLMTDCKEEFISKDQELFQIKKSSESEFGTFQSKIKSLQLNKESRVKSSAKAPLKVQFIEQLTKILSDRLPDFWHLGQVYLTGKLRKEHFTKQKTFVDSQKSSAIKEMVFSVVLLSCNLIRAAFIPQSLKKMSLLERDNLGSWSSNAQDSPIAWLPTSVRYIRQCVIGLSPLELPSETQAILQNLSFQMRFNCVQTLLEQSIEDIKALNFSETWIVDSDDERGGTTLLPALFENIVSETIQHLLEIIQPKHDEEKLFENDTAESMVTDLCTQLIRSFAITLNVLANVGNEEKPRKKTDDDRRSAISSEIFSEAGQEMPAEDIRYIIMLSNCNHTVEHVLPRLISNLQRHGYPNTDRILKDATESYCEVDEQLFNQYTEAKSNPIIGRLETSMYAGLFDWNNCLYPTAVRRYVKEAIMGMIHVHSEVYSISPHFVSRVMLCVAVSIIDEVSRLLQCVSEFSINGALQARLDLAAFDAILSSFSDPDIDQCFREALKSIPAIDLDQKRVQDELLLDFKKRMKFQLMCFNVDTRLRAPTF